MLEREPCWSMERALDSSYDENERAVRVGDNLDSKGAAWILRGSGLRRVDPKRFQYPTAAWMRILTAGPITPHRIPRLET